MITKMSAFKNDRSNIKKVLHEIESKKQGLEYEVLTILSSAGEILGEYQGTSHAVKVPEKDYSKCKGNILTHNHADNRTFTNIDILFFINSEAKETRVSTDNGKYYSLEVNNKKLQKELWNSFQTDKVGFTQKIVHQLGREFDIATFVITDEIRDLTATDIDNLGDCETGKICQEKKISVEGNKKRHDKKASEKESGKNKLSGNKFANRFE